MLSKYKFPKVIHQNMTVDISVGHNRCLIEVILINNT